MFSVTIDYTDPSEYSVVITQYVCSALDSGETANGVALFSDTDMKELAQAIAEVIIINKKYYCIIIIGFFIQNQTSVCYNIMVRKEECYRKCLNITSTSMKDDQDTVVVGFKIISKNTDCKDEIYKSIKAYYKGATKAVRLAL